MKLWIIFVLILMVVAFTFLKVSHVFDRGRSTVLSSPPQHGTAFILEYDPTRVEGYAIAKLKESMRKRLFHLGVDMYWEPLSSNRVRITTPIETVKEAETAKSYISQRGLLEFRLVHENSGELIKQQLREPGYELLKEKQKLSDGTSAVSSYLVKVEPELGGGYIESAYESHDAMGNPEITFSLDAEGAKKFQKLTGDNVGRQLAIVLDGQVQSAPRINGPIPGGHGVIPGNFTEAEAHALANILDCPLSMPVKIIESKTF